TARVLSGFVHALCVRTFAQDFVERLARAATVPVVNALTDATHPLQLLADLLALRQRLGRLAGLKAAWIGDGNNVAHALGVAAALMAAAAPDAVALHCLPAPRGEEIAADVLDGPRSLAWEAAEARLHTAKAVLEWTIAH